MNRITILFLIGLISIPTVVFAKPFMYVPSGDANDIVIIDLATDEIIGRINELENAHGLSGSINTPYLVAGSMLQVDPSEHRQVDKPDSVSQEDHIAHHSNTETDNSTAKQLSYISIIHPEHGHVMRRIEVRGMTHHTAISPDGKKAIAVHSRAGGISVIDLDKMEVTKELQTGNLPNYALFSSDGEFIYVSNAGSGTISEIETDTWDIKRVINVGKSPEHFVISPDDSKLYVANVSEGSISVVDLDLGNQTKSYASGASPHGVDISEDNKWLFISSKEESKLSRIDLENDNVKQISLEPAPYHLEYVDEVSKLYVSSRKQPVIWVVDPETLSIRKTIDIENGVAHQMVIRLN